MWTFSVWKKIRTRLDFDMNAHWKRLLIYPKCFMLNASLILVCVLGQYPEWDEDHPIHFVGHSAGAQVVRVLQQMLADQVCVESFF